MAATGDLEVRFQRVESKIDALGMSVDEMSADHRDHTDFAVERLGTELRARFDAVDGRFDIVDARLERVEAKFDAMQARFDAMEGRFDNGDARVGTVLARLDGTDTRLERMDVRFTRLERKVDRILEHLLPGAAPDTRSPQ